MSPRVAEELRLIEEWVDEAPMLPRVKGFRRWAGRRYIASRQVGAVLEMRRRARIAARS